MTSPTIQQKWTPGPWETGPFEGRDRHKGFYINGPPDSGPHLPHRIADVRAPEYFRRVEQMANARLIAAAPEMYDLLDESMTDLNCVRAPERAAPRLQCDCWKCVFANRVYALMKRIKGEQ